jgi:hypothetical protein
MREANQDMVRGYVKTGPVDEAVSLGSSTIYSEKTPVPSSCGVRNLSSRYPCIDFMALIQKAHYTSPWFAGSA